MSAAAPLARPGGTARPRAVVLGGGITGLAAAHRLVERLGGSAEILLLEASPRLGGVISTERVDGFLLEHGPDSFVIEKPQAADLARSLGLGDALLPTNESHRRTLVVRAGRLMPLPEAFQLMAPARLGPFLRSPILGWRGKLAALGDLVAPRGGPPPGGDESLASFVRRRLGREVLERIAQPMVGGIYTADPETLSLAATMPRFLELERRHRSLILGLMRTAPVAAGTSGARFGLFATLRDGLGSLVDALARSLPAGSARPSTAARSVGRSGPGGAPLRVTTAGGEEIGADAVLVALPAPRAAEVLASLDGELSRGLAAIPCASSAVVTMAFDHAAFAHPPDAFGVVVPEIERREIVACSFSSVKYAGRAPSGHVLVRAFVGGALHPDALDRDDAALVEVVRRELADLLGAAGPPLLARVARWPQSMPQYLVGHAARAEAVRAAAARHPGLALAGNAYDGVGISDCIRNAHAAADAIAARLGGAAAGVGAA